MTSRCLCVGFCTTLYSPPTARVFLFCSSPTLVVLFCSSPTGQGRDRPVQAQPVAARSVRTLVVERPSLFPQTPREIPERSQEIPPAHTACKRQETPTAACRWCSFGPPLVLIWCSFGPPLWGRQGYTIIDGAMMLAKGTHRLPLLANDGSVGSLLSQATLVKVRP